MYMHIHMCCVYMHVLGKKRETGKQKHREQERQRSSVKSDHGLPQDHHSTLGAEQL